MARYIPDRGDVLWITFDPRRGHEQKGRRPALALSPKEYNRLSGLVIVCPVTSHAKGYQTEVSVSHSGVEGVILSDHVHSLSWKERRVEKIARAPAAVTEAVAHRLRLLVS